MGSQFSSPDAALPDLRAYLEQQKLRAYLEQQKLAHVREAKQPRQDIIKAALAKTLALAFAECKLLGFDSGAPWCPHRVERRASPQFVSRLFDDYARQFGPMLLETLNYCAHARVADLISEQRRDGRILDAGCGSGLLGAELRKRSPETELFGVDVSSKIAKLARDKREAAGKSVAVRDEEIQRLRSELEQSRTEAAACQEDFARVDHGLNVARRALTRRGEEIQELKARLDETLRQEASRGEALSNLSEAEAEAPAEDDAPEES